MVKQSKVVTLQLEEPEKRKNTVETRIHLKMFLFRWTDINTYHPVHPIFRFWVTFDDKVTKILYNLCLHFARQDGQDGKKTKENHATENQTKTKIWDE